MKHLYGIFSFVSAIIIGFVAMLIPPQGIIDSSVLWFTAQLLLFTANILGVDYYVFKTNFFNKSSKKD